MLRFNPANKLSENFYVRQDGTRAYYFSKGELDQLVILPGYWPKYLLLNVNTAAIHPCIPENNSW